MLIKAAKPSLRSIFACFFSSGKDAQLLRTDMTKIQERGSITKKAERVFEQFFQQNPPKQSEMSFFDSDSLNQTKRNVFQPLKILGLKSTAGLSQIKQAYRKLAIESHPLINQSSESQQKFIDLARAYETLVSQYSKTSQQRSQSYMEQFDESVEQQMMTEAQTTQEFDSYPCKIKIAQLYSQSKSVKKFGNKTQTKIVKQYNRDGKLTKITRIEKSAGDGLTNVFETFDNGEQLKSQSYTKTNKRTSQLL